MGRTVGGRYRLISRLGSGGMSSVHLARHVLIDRLVAVKSLRRDLAQDPVQRDRFIREARAANRVNHENIVEITDFGETEDGLVYLVMEYVPGEPLYKAMARGPFASTRALHIAEQIGSALGRAHQMGVVHRDLKPENLLLVPRADRPDFIKILDFGIAKILDAPSLTGSQQIFGTPGYIAPEYIQSTNIDGRADLYSLGVILYELVTGALPFDYEYPGDLLVKHVTEAPIRPRKRRAEVEPAMEDLILQCLEKNPDRRFRDAYEFLEALTAVRERLGGDESWGGLSETRTRPPRDDHATPVMSPGSPDDLVRCTIPAGPPAGLEDAVDSGFDDDPLGATEPDGAPLEPDGLDPFRRWRLRFDALGAALAEIERQGPLPASIAEAMALCATRLDALEAALAEVAHREGATRPIRIGPDEGAAGYGDDALARLDALADPLRAPLDAVERYVRRYWDEHPPAPDSVAPGR